MKKKAFIIIVAVLSVFIITAVFCLMPIFTAVGDTDKNFAFTVMQPIDFGGSIPPNAARSAIVIDAESGNILFSDNADEQRGMASTTKIMTALIAIENCDPADEFLIPKEAVGIEGSSVYLKENEPLTLEELLYCLLLESGNDAATAIAICCGGSIDNFVKMMNDRAFELGLENTRFANPHGLSDKNHYTTARELALITAQAMKYPLFNTIVATKNYKVRYDGIERARALTNHNKLLFNYDGAIGVKTGYTSVDGRCLVSAAERGGLTLIAVTLNDPFPASTHFFLLDGGFSQFTVTKAADIGDITVNIPAPDTERGFVTVINRCPAEFCIPKNAAVTMKINCPKIVSAPICENEILGEAVFYADGKLVYIIKLEATESLLPKKINLFEKMFKKE